MSAEPSEEHRRLQAEAVDADAAGHRALLAGTGGQDDFARAAALYRRSWDVAPPGSWGRLVGLAKAALLAGGREDDLRFVAGTVGLPPASPVAAWAGALAALGLGDDARAAALAGAMEPPGEAFARTAAAVRALASGDGAAYAAAVEAIVADFAARAEHLTGVPIADTAVVLERLAAARGLAAAPASELVP